MRRQRFEQRFLGAVEESAGGRLRTRTSLSEAESVLPCFSKLKLLCRTMRPRGETAASDVGVARNGGLLAACDVFRDLGAAEGAAHLSPLQRATICTVRITYARIRIRSRSQWSSVEL